MIAKCLAILAVVAQISASGCGCGLSSMIAPSLQPTPVVLVSSDNSGFSESSSGAVMRNIVAKGKYPVALRSCGPPAGQQVSIINSRVTTPVQEKPTIRLPASIPAPRTISHSCTCYKTILRPRVHQQLITVPSLQRYVETSHKPVFENIQYEAVPVTCEGPGVQLVQVRGGSSGSSGLMTASLMVPQMQSMEVPRVQVVEAQRVQPFQTVQIPQPVSFEPCTCQC